MVDGRDLRKAIGRMVRVVEARFGYVTSRLALEMEMVPEQDGVKVNVA